MYDLVSRNLILQQSQKQVLAATIKQFHSNKAPGLDKISNKLIKLAGNAVYDSILHIFNLILDTGIFPEDLKLTRVTPTTKKETSLNVETIDLYL
jgi:hypothetical protein